MLKDLITPEVAYEMINEAYSHAINHLEVISIMADRQETENTPLIKTTINDAYQDLDDMLDGVKSLYYKATGHAVPETPDESEVRNDSAGTV